MALINQKYGRQGQADFTLYALANQHPSVFHDITVGTNDTLCIPQESPECNTSLPAIFFPTLKSYGVYAAGAGYDMASGLGSVDGNALVSDWNSISFLPTTTTLSLSPTSVVHGSPVTFTATVSATSGSATPAGDVNISSTSAQSLPQSGAVPVVNGTATESVNFFPGGTYNVTADYAGDGTFAPSTSAPLSLTVTPEASAVAPIVNYDTTAVVQGTDTEVAGRVQNGQQIAFGGTWTFQATPTGVTSQTSGLATGTVTFTDGSTSTAVPIGSLGTATIPIPVLAVGSHSVGASYSGDASYQSSTGGPLNFTVVQGSPRLLLAPNFSQFTVNGSVVPIPGGTESHGRRSCWHRPRRRAHRKCQRHAWQLDSNGRAHFSRLQWRSVRRRRGNLRQPSARIRRAYRKLCGRCELERSGLHSRKSDRRCYGCARAHDHHADGQPHIHQLAVKRHAGSHRASRRRRDSADRRRRFLRRGRNHRRGAFTVYHRRQLSDGHPGPTGHILSERHKPDHRRVLRLPAAGRELRPFDERARLCHRDSVRLPHVRQPIAAHRTLRPIRLRSHRSRLGRWIEPDRIAFVRAGHGRPRVRGHPASADGQRQRNGNRDGECLHHPAGRSNCCHLADEYLPASRRRLASLSFRLSRPYSLCIAARGARISARAQTGPRLLRRRRRASINACGGGSTPIVPQKINTPPGTYGVLVTATAGGATHNAKLTVVVQ